MARETSKYPPFNYRQFFNFLKRRFGKSYLTTKFNVGERQVDRWTADHRYVGEEGTRKNPGELLKECFEDCAAYGHEFEALGVLSELAQIFSHRVVHDGVVVIEPGDIRDKILDAGQSLGDFQEAVRGRASPEEIRHLGNMAMTTIWKAVEFYPTAYNIEKFEQLKPGRP